MDISNFFNKDVWKSLTPEERDVIKKVADEFNDRYARTVMEKEASWKKDMETKHGVTFHELDKEAHAQNLAAMKVARDGLFREIRSLRKQDQRGVGGVRSESPEVREGSG